MEQVKNLNDKRVCDQSKDGKVIVTMKEKRYYIAYCNSTSHTNSHPGAGGHSNRTDLD